MEEQKYSRVGGWDTSKRKMKGSDSRVPPPKIIWTLILEFMIEPQLSDVENII